MQVSNVFSNLCPGVYSLCVNDANGCGFVQNVTISEPALLELHIDSIVNTSGFTSSDGEILVSATGGVPGYQYTIDTVLATPPFTGLTLGSYDICVEDQNGCSTCTTVLVDFTNSVDKLSAESIMVFP